MTLDSFGEPPSHSQPTWGIEQFDALMWRTWDEWVKRIKWKIEDILTTSDPTTIQLLMGDTVG
jgi:hypothetical protein